MVLVFQFLNWEQNIVYYSGANKDKCHSSLLTTRQERILSQLTYLALFSQPIYFVNAHFLLTTDYYISSWSFNCKVVLLCLSFEMCMLPYTFWQRFCCCQFQQSCVPLKHTTVYPYVCGLKILVHTDWLLHDFVNSNGYGTLNFATFWYRR